MRLMVTGGLGVNGAWVVRELLDRGHEVVIFENRDDTSLIEDVADQIELIIGDVCDVEGLTRAATQFEPECVIHLAAFVDCERIPLMAISVNVSGTAAVCAAAASAGVRRVVYTSSKAVYAPATGKRGFPTYEPVSEDDERRPTGMYGITKSAGEDVVAWYGRTSDLECVSLRFSTVFGPGRLQRHGGGINTYSSMVELPALGEPFELDHGGEERDDRVYVLDVADAIATVALHPDRLPHSVYNVASGSAVSMHQFADAVRRVISDAAVDVGPGRNPMDSEDPYYMALANTRMEEDLGWRPNFTLDDAIRHYVGVVTARSS